MDREALDALAARLLALPPAPAESGRLARLVVRPARGERRCPAEAAVTVERGIEGDRWFAGSRKPFFGRLLGRDRQVTAIRADVAEVLAGGQDPALTGDNLHVELDLSLDNLPPGSLVRVGTAVLEVSKKPHSGCARFRERFGDAAGRINADPRFKGWRLRGVLLSVAQDGRVRPGDAVEVVSRGAPAQQRLL